MRNMIDLMCLIGYLILAYLLFCINVNIAFLIITLTFIIMFINYKNCNYRIESACALKIQKQQDFFVDKLKHDLSIPAIAQLRGLEILKSNNYDTNSINKEILDEVEKSSKYLVEMISMLIDGKYGKYKVTCEEVFDVDSVVRECLVDIKEDCNEKKLKVNFNTDKYPAYICAERLAIKKVIKNLLHNAVSYSKLFDNININLNILQNMVFINISYSNEKKSDIYNTVGEDIRMCFYKRIIKFNHGKILTSGSKNICKGFCFPLSLQKT